MKTRTFWVFICISLVIVGAIVNNLQHPAQAQYTQNDNNGQWTLTFNTNAGIAENNGVTVNGVSATATIPATSTGNILTSTIKPASFSKWNTLGVEGTWSNTSAVKVQLYTCDTIPALLPTNILSLTGQGDNAAGYTLVGGVLDLSSLSTTSYPCLQVRVLLTSDSTSPAPVIRKVIASWSPLTVFLLNLTAPTTKQVGDKLTYTADYSVSYATDHDVIVWMPAPQPKSGTYTPSYGQNLTASFVSATNGGQFTSTALTINGISIPANSVYWTLGTQAAGSTGSLSASFGTSSGTQNSVVYTTQAQIDSPRSDQVTSDASATTPGAQPVESVMTSQPYPSIIKSASGIMLDNDIHIYSGAPYNNTTTYTITVENSQTAALIGAETMFNTIVTDDLTDIFSKLSSSACGNVANPATRISLISNSGVLDSTAKTITWNLANMTPRSTLSTTFVVDYSGCADTTRITNNTTLKADNVAELTATKDVVIGVNPTPSGIYAKGDRTKVAGILPGINSGVDNNAPKSNDPTDLAGKTTYDGTTTYTLLTQNTSAVRLDKTVMMDMIPAGTSFISASIPVDVGATIYYFTGTSNTDPQVGPSFDVANLSNPGGGWTTTAPSTSSDVTWVAFYVPCLSSASIPAGGSCADKPSSAVGEITVKVLSPSATNPVSQTTCSVYDIENFGLFTTYAGAASVSDQSDANVATFATPLSYVDNNELTHVVPKLASFKTSSNMSGPSQLDAGATGVYTIHYQNDGEATAKNATIDISIPTVDISGVPTPLDFVDFTGAPYTKTLDGNGKVTAIHVTVGDIPSGASRDFTLSLAAPRGANQNTNVTVTAVLSASDPDNCAPINQSLTASTTLKGAPILSVFKTRDESLIKATEDIHYQLAFTSTGDTPTSDTFIIDRVPAKTVFKQAYTNGTSLDANGNSYTCLNCKVYFSRGNPPLPANISAVQQLTPTQIYANFSLGIETSPGIWAPPASMATTDVVYVAYLLDNGALAKPQLASGTSGVVGMTVTNDNNGGAPGTAGSSVGTVIYNYAAIISNQTLQAIGNTVTTTILDDPGLIIDKTTPTSVVTADESFDWFITYKNDSSSNDTSAVITENLPYGVSLQDIYNTWNDLAISHGLSSGETTITSNPSVSMVTNVDGTTTVTITIAQALRTGDLLPQEGGTLRLRVKVNSGMGSGIRLNNKATACYSNQLAGPFCSDDESAVVVQNADLWLRKQVSNTSPLAGESLTYSLVVANKGLHDAVNTTLTDTLPAGICFDSVNIVTPSGWSIGAPTISGGPCATAPTTLTWNVANGNALTNSSLAPGTIPGNSPDITLQYNVHVDSSIVPGTALTNGASVSTTTPEDSVYPNTDNKQVVTPLPDPYVHKTVSSPSVLPGGSFDYYIDYGNNSREAAQGVYVVDGLPDINGDGKTDITISAVLPSNGESVYYYDENTNPALSTLGLNSSYTFSTDSRFKTSLSQYPVGEYPTHIIIVGSGSLAGLEGPHRVLVQAQMINPYTQTKLPAGSVVDNHVNIYSTTQDGNTTNNSADAITRVPAADLSISKTADPSGNYPGTTPGGMITYTINFANTGASPICSVYIQEAYDSNLTNITNSFTTLHLTNSAGMPVLPLDPAGNTISQPVNVTYDAVLHRWQLGSSDSVSYSNVCLPSGSHGSFAVTATVFDSTVDGTKITNTATIGEDSAAIEDTLTNNTASVDTSVYRADLRIKKDGLSAGPDGMFWTADDSATVANPGEQLRYTLKYNNVGNLDAENAKIDEMIPEGVCFTAGSIANVPDGAVLGYSNDAGSTYNYVPTGTTDCNVTNFRVSFGTLPAPANVAAGTEILDTGMRLADMPIITDAIQVVTSGYSAYALMPDGSIKSWGYNNYGQLGNGTTTDSSTPVTVTGITGATQIVTNGSSTYALMPDGSIKSWGLNNYGQLGNGTTTNSSTPVTVTGITGATKVVTNGSSTYALMPDGSIKSWGRNNYGQLGNGTTTNSSTPVTVTGITGATQVVLSLNGSTYALMPDGSIKSWGLNNYGQLGNGTTTNSSTPVTVTGITGATQIVTNGYNAYALMPDGSIKSWGRNNYGQLGNGTTTDSSIPTTVLVLDELPNYESGTLTIPLSTANTPLTWKKLYINAKAQNVLLPSSQITYNLLQADCATPIAGFDNIDPSNPRDISSLSPSVTSYCLQVVYVDIPSTDFTARMSFESAEDPYITFDAAVRADISRTTIDNLATISTDTAEIRYDNNDDDHRFRVPFADAALTKDVDVASINLAAVAVNTPLTYTLTLTNNGPNPIVKPIITDTLPAGLTYASFTKASGPSTVNFASTQSGQVITLSSADTLAVGETVVLKLVATVNSGATIGSQFYNDAVVTSSTADTNLDNNADSATTTVGDLANVYIQKTAPVKAHINKDITYTITYGNNGNIAATNWSLTDPLDSNLDFVSATQTAGTPAVTCTNSGNTVTCTPDGGANLPAGATGTIQIVAHVHNDQTLADNTTVITNNAHIQTDTAQVTVSDDDSQATTTIWPGDLSGFGGRVFVDYNKDVLYTAGSDTPIKDVAVYASGYDTKNNIYGPAATDANYTAVMTSLLPILIANSIVPAGTTVADLSTLPNYVTVTPQKTLTDGTYAFSGLQPGTYYATEIQPVGYASTGSDAGYLSLDTNGLPVASPQDGQGSVESGNLAMVNNISTIVLGEGDFSAANNFGELPGTIGNFIWKDANGDGVYQTGEQPLSGIQVSLYNDVNKDGIYTSGVDTLVAMTATDVNGQYTFNGLSLDDGTGDAHYVVVVTDISGALAGYTNTTGTVGADNNSQKATGYAVVLSPTVTSNLTADFGYLRPVNIDLTKQIDGDGGGIYNTTEQITADQPFDYRVSVGNSALDTATGVEVVDTLPAGVTLLSVTTSAGSATPTTGLAPQVVWTVGTLTPNIRQTMTLHVVVKSADLATYRSNLTSAGTNRNVAQVTKQNEPDSNSTPNNMVSPFNITTHEDDEAYADTYMLAALGDYAWVDLNGNGIQDTGEPGLNGVTVELLDSSGAVIATTVTAANGAQNGYYTFGNLTVGMNYTVHFVTPTGYLLTQTGKGTAATGSDANPLDGKTAAVSLTTSEYNTSIDAGFVPLITLGNTIWSDTNNNGIKDNGEVGIGGVTVLLYEDSNGDNVLDPNVDTQVANTTTDANGVYTFANLLAGKYFVAIPSAQLTSGALAGYTMSPSMTTDPNDNVTGVNDGVFGTMFVTTAKPIILAYGSEPSGQGYVNTTLSFGFYKAAVPTNPSNPLANTGQSIIGIVIASVSIIGTAIALLFFGRRRTRDSKKG